MLVLLLLIAAVGVIVVAVLAHRAHDQSQRSAEHAALEQLSRRASRRLYLRRPEPADVDFFLEMAADPVAAEANGWTGSEVQVVRARFATPKLFAELRAGELVAVERTSDTPVATIRFSVSQLGPDGARSIGVHVHPDHRNRGYGRETMAAAILVLQAGSEPIHVGTRTTNLGMQRIMHQLGFEPEPGTRAYAAPDGNSYASYWYICSADIHPPSGLFDD